MSRLDPDALHRTLKIEVDEGRAASLDEAAAIAASHVLQVVVGKDVGRSQTRQAMLVTVLNCAPRAFIGGVHVDLQHDDDLSLPWHEGMSISHAITHYGASGVDELRADYPTLVIGSSDVTPPGSVVLRPTWNGWSAAVVRSDSDRLAEQQEMRLAGILAGTLAVAETFQHIRGDVVAGHRDLGLSLWDLSADWHGAEAVGPERFYLPDALWLAGLGHLGQAYCWAIGLLPYADHAAIRLTLQDDDVIVAANEATSLLVQLSDIQQGRGVGERKTRLVARRLEELGVKTTLVERHLDVHTIRQPGEPRAIVGGFDDPRPRRLLESLGFDRVFDAGLGGGARGYLDISIHSFPSQLAAASSFQSREARAGRELQPAYAALVEELVSAGMSADQARCGVVDEIAGKTVAASFVGVVAACLVLSEILRDLALQQRYAFIDLSLREPAARQLLLLSGNLEPSNYGSVLSIEPSASTA